MTKEMERAYEEDPRAWLMVICALFDLRVDDLGRMTNPPRLPPTCYAWRSRRAIVPDEVLKEIERYINKHYKGKDPKQNIWDNLA